MIYLYFILILISIIFRNSKRLYYIDIFFLFLLFAFNYENADRHIYDDRYYYYDDEYFLNITEPFFTGAVSILNKLGMQLQHFIMIVAFFFLYSLKRLIDKFTAFGCYVIAFYMLTEYFFDVVQLRYSIGLIFLYFGLVYLLSEIDRKKAVLKFLLFIVCGSLFHFSIAYYSVFALSRLMKSQHCIAFVVLFALSVGTLMSFFSEYADALSMADKVEAVEDGSYMISKWGLIYIRIRILFFETIPFILIFFILHKKFVDDLFLTTMYKITILLWTAIPLLFVSVEFHRAFFAMMIVIQIALSRFMIYEKKYVLLIYGSSLLTIFSFVYDMYIKDAAFIQNNVILPVLTKNLLFYL